MTDAIAATAAPGRSGWWRALVASPVLIALAGGLAAKAPDLYDKIWERQHETGGRSRAFVQQQNIGFDRNPTCGNLAPVWRPALRGAQIDATICDNTGDILVVAKQPSGRMKQTWLTVEALSAAETAPELAALFGSPAHAALPSMTPALARPAMSRAPGIELAQTVLCQTRLDDRTIVRHVRLPDGCYDITIDTYSGSETRRVRVPCRTGC